MGSAGVGNGFCLRRKRGLNCGEPVFQLHHATSKSNDLAGRRAELAVLGIEQTVRRGVDVGKEGLEVPNIRL